MAEKRMVSIDEARRIFFAALGKHVERTEILPIDQALGRITARDQISAVDVPDFRRSAMDGYAVRSQDVQGASPSQPVRLRLAGEVAMGREAGLQLREGEAAYVTTGGWVPDGADAVVMVENTRSAGDHEVDIMEEVHSGKNVISPGDDVRRGERVLPGGRLIRPEDISALAGVGQLEVEVFEKPKVAILTTGDELIPADQKPKPGQVRDSNSWGLAAAITMDGGRPFVRSQIPDEMDAFRAILRHALEHHDMLIVSGGSSMGKRDYTPDLIAELAPLMVYGIEIKPGKPTVLTVTEDGKPIIGLPGNPVPALLIYGLFGRPALRVRSGLKHWLPPARIEAVLSRDWQTPKQRDEFIRVRLVRSDSGYLAEPIPGHSGFVTHLTHADGVVFGPRNQMLRQGTPVAVLPFAGSAFGGETNG